jgi:hypothetical protein
LSETCDRSVVFSGSSGFLKPIKLTATNWNNVESGVKHHQRKKKECYKITPLIKYVSVYNPRPKQTNSHNCFHSALSDDSVSFPKIINPHGRQGKIVYSNFISLKFILLFLFIKRLLKPIHNKREIIKHTRFTINKEYFKHK